MKRLLVSAAILLLVLTSTGFAQYSFDFTGGGARARAMGGAFIGLSDDASGGSWNPAGLWIHNTPQMSFSYGLFVPRGEFAGPAATADQTGNWNSVTFLNFLAPLRLRGQHFVATINYSRAFEDYTFIQTNLDGQYQVLGMGSASTYDQFVEQESHQAPNMLNVGFGTKLYQNISFGSTVNVYLGQGVTNSRFVTTLNDFPHPQGVAETGLGVENLLINDSTSYSGVNFTVGLKYNGEQFGAGLIVRTPFAFKAETDAKRYRVFQFAGNDQIDGSDTTYFDDNLVKYNMPIMIGLGFSYQASEKLLVAFDGEFRPFSGQKLEVRDSIAIIPGAEDEEFFTEVDPEWENVFVFRGGAEYVMTTGKGYAPYVPLRLGFAYTPIPTPNLNENFELTSASGFSITAGAGIQYSQIHLDVSYSYSAIDRETVLLGLGVQGDLIANDQPPVGADLNNRTHEINFSFTGYF